MEKRQSNSTETNSRSSPRLAENVVSNAEERYRLVIEAVAEGIYEWTIKTNHLELSSRLSEMFGFKKAELTSANWVERVHPEDRARYRDTTLAYFKGSTPHFSCQYRILNKQGEWRWVSDRATSIRDANRRVLRLIGAVTDITELRETLQQQATTAEGTQSHKSLHIRPAGRARYTGGILRHGFVKPIMHGYSRGQATLSDGPRGLVIQLMFWLASRASLPTAKCFSLTGAA